MSRLTIWWTVNTTYGISVILTTIFLPIMIYYGYKYTQITENLYNNRYGHITICEIIITIFNMILKLCAMGFYMHPITSSSTAQSWIMYLTNTLWNISWFLLLTFWTYRFWLLRFKITFMHITLIRNWTKYINPEPNDNEKWVLQNKNKFGHCKYKCNLIIFILCNILGVMYYILSLAYFYFVNARNNLTMIFNISHQTIPIIFFVVLWILYCKIPTFVDIFYVKGELFWLLITLSFMILPSFAASSIWYYVAYLQPKSTYGIANTLQIIVQIARFSSIFVTTKLVISKLAKFEKKNTAQLSTINSMSTEVTELIEIKHLTNQYIVSELERDLKLIIANKSHFEVFLKYLSNESRIPYLLALIEITQFQNYVMKQQYVDLNKLKDEYQMKPPLFQTIQFYQDVPKSKIVISDNDDIKECEQIIKYKANLLFERYIAFGPYKNELTISLDTTNIVEDTMYNCSSQETIDVQDIMHRFDDVCQEIWNILNDSFCRFQKTKQYETLYLTIYQTQ